jgi:hypothetical protein
MKNFHFGTAKVALAVMIAVSAFSCKREIIEKTYPETLTMQNWEQFVDAPQHIIDQLIADEQASLPTSTNKLAPGFVSGDQPEETTFGWIRGFNGAWNNLPGAKVVSTSCGTTTTVGNTPSGFNYFLTCNSWKCITYTTPVINGVSTLDLVLIQRHILGIQLFTDYRQLVAADVNSDGVLNDTDLTIIREIILGVRIAFPTENVRFVHESFYNNAQTDWTLFQFYAPFPLGNCNNPLNYYGVKMGDVNGSFVF